MDVSAQLPVFIGLDLVWGPRNPTGGAVLLAGRLVEWHGDLDGDDAIIDLVGRHLSDARPAIVAIDAPLQVDNPPGSRRGCDSELSRDFGRFKCAAHTVNRGTPAFADGGRGAKLVRILASRFGFVEGTPIGEASAARHVVEVYPHPAHVVLFDLDERMKYKRRLGRSNAALAAEMVRYQDLLRSLKMADPSLQGVDDALIADLGSLRGKSYKSHEDTLDAITCAYIAAWLWRYGSAQARVYGSAGNAEIVVPGFATH